MVILHIMMSTTEAATVVGKWKGWQRNMLKKQKE
jgi:hypothetical protein